MTPELQKAIVDGVMGMVALRLRGSPGTDTAASTAKLWIAAIASRPIAWDTNLDMPRIHAAFVQLAATAEAWPSPAEFIRALPPRAHQGSLAAPVDNHMSPATRAMVDGLLQRLRRNVSAEQ